MAETATKVPAIYAAIARVIADVGYVGKDKVNKQQGFKFRSVDDVYNALHPALAKNKVFIVPEILEQTREVVGTTSKGSKMTLVICKIKFTFFAEDGSFVESVIIGEGIDMADKGTNKAMAIAYKYACFQVFCIPTEEMVDPDSESHEIKDNTNNKQPAQAKAGAVKENPKQDKNEQTLPDKITEAMLNTIRSEQERTGVADKVILARKSVKSKKIEDMTVEEFKAIMEVFKITPDLKKEEPNE